MKAPIQSSAIGINGLTFNCRGSRYYGHLPREAWEINRIEKLVEQNAESLLRGWISAWRVYLRKAIPSG
jgi:hypothetical protein